MKLNLSNLNTILLDMDGVLWHGSKPLLDIQFLFDQIRRYGLQPYCVTNNSTRPVQYHLERMSEFGVDLDHSQILTSAESTALFLERKFPEHGDVFVIGEVGIKEALIKKGFRLLKGGEDGSARAVVVGLDRNFSYQDFDLAVRYLQGGAFLIGTNPDATIPTPNGFAPGAGALIRGIEVSSGRKAHIVGKPHSGLYLEALERAGSLPEQTLMIGDRLETDIQGAQQVGLRTALVLSGITTMKQAQSWEPRPDIIAEDALQVIELVGMIHG